MAKRLLATQELRIGITVFAVPKGPRVARGPMLDPLPEDGLEVRLTDYLLGAYRRGSVLFYSPDAAEAKK